MGDEGPRSLSNQNAQDGAIVTPRSAFGTTARVRGSNGICMDGKQLLYPCGVFCAMYSLGTNEMSFITGHDTVKCIVGIAMSKNKKYIACIEDVEDSEAQQVSVYSMQSQKLVRSLGTEAATVESPHVQSIHFSENSKLLISQHGEPDNTLIVWRWYSGKVISAVRFDSSVVRAAFSPVDNALFATVCGTTAGMHVVDVNEGSVRSLPVVTAADSARESAKGQFTTFAWLVGNLLAFATNQGWVQVYQDAVCKGSMLTQEGDHLMAVAPRLRGFVAAGCMGVLYFFDPSDHQAKRSGPFMLSRKLNVEVPSGSLPSLVPMPGASAGMMARHAVTELSVNGSEDSLTALTVGGEMLTLNMLELQDREEKQVDQHMGHVDEHEHGPFRLFCGGFGRARIVGLHAILSPAFMLTVSADRMVRLYNYETQRSVAVAHLEDDPCCCALHPSGTQMLVGMHSGLRLYGVALDELSQRADFGVRRCSLARYSFGGSMFAAVGRSHTIVVHHAYSTQQLGQLKGHISAVTSISFSPNDRMLVSCGAGGAIYFWDLSTFNRIMDLEYVDKMSIYCSTYFLSRNTGTVVRTHDGRIQHVQGGKVEFEVSGSRGGDNAPTLLLGDDSVLLVASQKGYLQSYPWPTSFPVPAGAEPRLPQEYRLHAQTPSGITAMVALPTKGLVLTAGADGTVMMSNLALVLKGQLLEVPDRSGSLQQHYVMVSEDRLHALKEKQMELLGLVAATRSASEYQTFRQTQALRDIITKLQDELSASNSALEESKDKVLQLLASAESRERALVKELESSHMSAAEELETLYERRLEMEGIKQRRMAAATDDLQFRMEEAMAKLQAKQADEVRALEAAHRAKLDEVESQLHEVLAGQSQQERFHGEFAMQAEMDFDDSRERLEQRMEDAGRASAGREAKMRADNNLLKRTCLRLKGDKAIEMKKMDKMVADNNVLREGLAEQRVTMVKLRKELEERDVVMADNYTTIQMLRRKIQDLEKHKYVLGYKAATYEARLQPKLEEAERLAAELDAHDRELVSELAHVQELSRASAEKDQLIRSLKSEITDTKAAMKHQQNKLRMFSYDVNQVMNASDEPGQASARGGKSVRARLLEGLYKKYCIEGAAASSGEVAAELTRHLHMSELRGAVLEHRLGEAQRQGGMAQRLAVHENVQLLQELQVNAQGAKELARSLEAVTAELRELDTRYKILEARARQGGGGDTAPTTPADGADGGPTWEAERHAAGASSSMAGRIPPSRPTSAYPPVNRSWAAGAGAGMSRPTSAAAPNRGEQPPGPRMYRTAGAPVQGTVTRGSPVRVLHELIGAERERVTELMSQLQLSAEELERQRGAAQDARNALLSAAAAAGIAEEEEDEEDGGVGLDEPGPAAGGSGYTPGQVAQAIKRHGTSNQSNASRRPTSAAGKGPVAYGTPARRRPTSAAGVGMRAFVNGNVKMWREK